MARLGPILAFLVLIASSEAQKDGRATTGGTRVLQPWLVGLTAVVVFLFIVFVLMLINRIWCKKKRSSEDNPYMERIEDNAYTNLALVPDVEKSIGEQVNVHSRIPDAARSIGEQSQSGSGPDVESQYKPPESAEWKKDQKTEEKITAM